MQRRADHVRRDAYLQAQQAGVAVLDGEAFLGDRVFEQARRHDAPFGLVRTENI